VITVGATVLYKCTIDTTLAISHIGADFPRAMVVTAPGEKLLIGRRPVRNWTRCTIASLFLCRKLHLFLGKSTKTAATRAALFDSNMHRRLLAVACPIPHWGTYSTPPDLLAAFKGPTYIGRGEEEGREGVRPLP